MSGSPISRCTTWCPAASSRFAAARTTYACSVPSVSSRAAERMELLGALQIHALSRIHADLLAFGDELRDLDRDAVRQLGGLGARRLGGAPHDRGGLHD